MSVSSIEEFCNHYNHIIDLTIYGNSSPEACIECRTCMCVLCEIPKHRVHEVAKHAGRIAVNLEWEMTQNGSTNKLSDASIFNMYTGTYIADLREWLPLSPVFPFPSIKVEQVGLGKLELKPEDLPI